MALRNIKSKLLKAWFEMLNGHVTGFNVYRTTVPPGEKGNYIVLRIESETISVNRTTNVTNPVIISEVVTKFGAAIDDSVAGDADDLIAQLLQPGDIGISGLPAQSNMSITDVRRVNQTVVEEYDGTHLLYRLITRNLHRVVQT